MGQDFLAKIDVGPAGALLRIVLGAAFAWLVVTLHSTAPAWLAVLLFLGMLFLIKIGAGVLRAAIPAPPTVKAQWARRRDLARKFDSYQWRKLLWFGLGMLGVAGAGPRAEWLIPLGA